MIKHFIIAILAGISIAAPLGSNGIICIKLSLDKGFVAGLVSGLGESTVVGFYAWLLTYSSDSMESFLSEHYLKFRLLSGVILFLIGTQRFFSKKKVIITKKFRTQNSSFRFLYIYLFALGIALINPMTIVSLLGLISSFFNLANNFLIIPTVLGFVLGTAIWWFILSATVSYFRTKINRFFFHFINYSSGTFLMIIGLKSIFNQNLLN